MKRINVKRLAAIGAGAALVASALMPAASAAVFASRDELINNGVPVYDVVVGNSWHDAMWAGNIAAKLAQLAYTETPVQVEKSLGEGAGGEEVTPQATVSDLSVDLVVGGEVTYTEGSAYMYDDAYLNSVDGTTPEINAEEFTHSKLSTLIDESWSYTEAGSAKTQTVREFIGLTADAKFDAHKDVKDLVLYIDDDSFYYKVTLSEGIPFGHTKSDTDIYTVPFFGKKFTVLKVSADGKEMTLIDEANKETYYNGERITGLKGRDDWEGQTLEIEFETLVYDSQVGDYKAKLSLYDSEGNKIDTRTVGKDTFLENVFIVNGQYPLKTSVYIEDLGKEDVSGKGYVVVTVGTNTVLLKDGDKYPYKQGASTSEKYWRVEMSRDLVNNKVTGFRIYNAGIDGVSEWDRDMPVYAQEDSLTDNGDKSVAIFLNGESEDVPGYGFAKVRFYGFDKSERFSEFKFDDHTLYYSDTDETQHAIPMYFSGLSSEIEETFQFDKSGNKTYYFRLGLPDAGYIDFQVAENDLLNGVKVTNLDCGAGADTQFGTADDVLTDLDSSLNLNEAQNLVVGDNFYYAGQKFEFRGCVDATTATFRAKAWFQLSDESFDSWDPATNLVPGEDGAPLDDKYYLGYNTTPQQGVSLAPVILTGDNDKEYQYTFVYDGSDVWLLFNSQVLPDPLNNYTVAMTATDIDEDGNPDILAYVPNETELGGGNPGDYFVATFLIGEPGNAGLGAFFIDTEDGGLIPVGNNDLATYDAEFEYGNNNTGQQFDMTNYRAEDNIQKAWSDFGSYYDISEGYFYAKIPEERLKLKIGIEGPEAEAEISGEELSAAEGETVTTTAGTKITVKKINYNVSVEPSVCPSAGLNLDNVQVTVTPSTVKKIVPVQRLVFRDTEAYGDRPHILLGGWKRNKLVSPDMKLADGRTLGEVLTEPGTWVVDKLENGDVIVAGYTAEDTAAAAKEFMNELEALLGE